jgi:5-bromo-4-chloroindolyl phosphate hydrolysis protein
MPDRFQKFPVSLPSPAALKSGAVRFKQALPKPPSLAGLLLFLLPLPVLPATVIALSKGYLKGVLAYGAASALYLLGAILVRRGIHTAAEYQRRRVARPPRFPLKLAGLVSVAAATALTTFGAGYEPLAAALFGCGALLGGYLVYDLDPRTEKRAVDAHGLDNTEQVVAALTRAEEMLAAIERANAGIRNAEFNTRLSRIGDVARDILFQIEQDPRDLRRARKFLNVYLEGTQQVTEGYARTHRQTALPELEDNFRRVLINIEDVFREQQQKLLESDVTDLDVKIEVLNAQLQREGVV